MERQKKEKIDKIWKSTIIGEFIECYIENDEQRAEKIDEELFNSGYYGGICQFALSVGDEILKVIDGIQEWDEYLKEVDKDDPKIWEALYYTRVFDEFEYNLSHRE